MMITCVTQLVVAYVTLRYAGHTSLSDLVVTNVTFRHSYSVWTAFLLSVCYDEELLYRQLRELRPSVF